MFVRVVASDAQSETNFPEIWRLYNHLKATNPDDPRLVKARRMAASQRAESKNPEQSTAHRLVKPSVVKYKNYRLARQTQARRLVESSIDSRC